MKLIDITSGHKWENDLERQAKLEAIIKMERNIQGLRDGSIVNFEPGNWYKDDITGAIAKFTERGANNVGFVDGERRDNINMWDRIDYGTKFLFHNDPTPVNFWRLILDQEEIDRLESRL